MVQFFKRISCLIASKAFEKSINIPIILFEALSDFITIQKEVLSAPTKPKKNSKNHLQQNTNNQY